MNLLNKNKKVSMGWAVSCGVNKMRVGENRSWDDKLTWAQ